MCKNRLVGTKQSGNFQQQTASSPPSPHPPNLHPGLRIAAETFHIHTQPHTCQHAFTLVLSESSGQTLHSAGLVYVCALAAGFSGCVIKILRTLPYSITHHHLFQHAGISQLISLKRGSEGNKSGENGSSETLVAPHIGSSHIRLMLSLFKAALESQHSSQSVPIVRKARKCDSLRGAYKKIIFSGTDRNGDSSEIVKTIFGEMIP